MPFKAPDGKEFATRAEWRDYMMATFYSFKNKKSETAIKSPGEIDGQMFDIGDCEDSTLIIMDTCEQVQIDNCKNCRIFIGACASSIFIRNCVNCTFYTCCRQLRLREVTHSFLYVYSMSEVHIEESNNLKFAPFNGGYPDHARHISAVNLDSQHNLWYDIFDHNDPAKTRVNWALLDPALYEQPWFPLGTPCEVAVKITSPGSVVKQTEDGMQSFGVQQLISDSKTTNSPVKTNPPPPVVEPTPVPPPPVEQILPPAPPQNEEAQEELGDIDSMSVLEALNAFLILDPSAKAADATGYKYPLVDTVNEILSLQSLSFNNEKSFAWVLYTSVSLDGGAASCFNGTAILKKENDKWLVVHDHRSPQ